MTEVISVSANAMLTFKSERRGAVTWNEVSKKASL